MLCTCSCCSCCSCKSSNSFCNLNNCLAVSHSHEATLSSLQGGTACCMCTCVQQNRCAHESMTMWKTNASLSPVHNMPLAGVLCGFVCCCLFCQVLHAAQAAGAAGTACKRCWADLAAGGGWLQPCEAVNTAGHILCGWEQLSRIQVHYNI